MLSALGRRHRLTATLTAAVLVGFLGALPASGDDTLPDPDAPELTGETWAGCYVGESGCRPDSIGHGYCFGSSMDDWPRLRDGARYAANNLERQTVMTSSNTNNCTEVTDVQWRQTNLGGAKRGQYTCVDKNGTLCYKAIIQIDRSAIDAQGGPFYLNVQKTSCHELGHSVGMDHHNNYSDCQKNGPVQQNHVDYNYRPHAQFVDDYFN